MVASLKIDFLFIFLLASFDYGNSENLDNSPFIWCLYTLVLKFCLLVYTCINIKVGCLLMLQLYFKHVTIH